jgi:hypothetical protein
MTESFHGAPTETPPAEAASGATAGVSAQPTLQGPASAGAVAVTEPGPSMAPPAEAATTEGVTAATWRSGQVTALWASDDVRNAWMLVSGVGWRRIFAGRDGAFTALVALASQARQTGRTIQFREEADGMVYEIYLW